MCVVYRIAQLAKEGAIVVAVGVLALACCRNLIAAMICCWIGCALAAGLTALILAIANEIVFELRGGQIERGV